MNRQVLDTIYIKGLKTETVIGILNWEKEKFQPLIFDIEMDLPIFKAAKSDDIGDTVDYAKVSEDVINLVKNSRYDLLETLCEAISNHIFEHFSAVQVLRITVSKPMAVTETDTVGVKMTRYNHSLKN